MSGFIYLVENKISGQKYIGLTQYPIMARWKEHLRDARRTKVKDRPLQHAIKKYGADSFLVSQLEECEAGNLPEREIYWINKYDTYRNGYNATLGGDGRKSVDRSMIISEYSDCFRMHEVAKRTGCSVDTVKKVLDSESINRNISLERSLQSGCPIFARSEDGIISFFPSQLKAAEWIKKQLSGDERPLRRIASVIGKYSRKPIGRNIIYGYGWQTISQDEYTKRMAK